MAQKIIPARSLTFLFCRMEGTATKYTISASNTDSSPMAVQLLLTHVNMCEIGTHCSYKISGLCIHLHQQLFLHCHTA